MNDPTTYSRINTPAGFYYPDQLFKSQSQYIEPRQVIYPECTGQAWACCELDERGTDRWDDITDEESTQVIAVPELSIVKIGQPNPVEPGGTLIYTITYSNTGTAPATNVVVSDEFDSNVTFSAHTCEPRPDDVDESWASWGPGTLVAREQKTVVCPVVVTSTAPSYSVLRNIGRIQSDQGDAAPAVISTTVKQRACLDISPGYKRVIPPVVNQEVMFSHVLTNCGNGTDVVTVTSTTPSWLKPSRPSFTTTITQSSTPIVAAATILTVPAKNESSAYLTVTAISWADNSVVTFTVDQVEVRPFYVYLPLILRDYAEFCNGNFETGDTTCWTKYEDTKFPVDVVESTVDPGYNCFRTHSVRIGNFGKLPSGEVAIGRFGIAQTVVVSDTPNPKLEFDCIPTTSWKEPFPTRFTIFSQSPSTVPSLTFGAPGIPVQPPGTLGHLILPIDLFINSFLSRTIGERL